MTSNAQGNTERSALPSLFADREHDDLSTYLHRQLIGYAGATLPFLLWLIAALRPTTGLPRWELLDSISAYYYTGATAILVGALAALAAFLFTYRGYDNEHNGHERQLATVAALAAAGVALFPTGAPAGLAEPLWWSPQARTIHYVSAVVLFLAFILFTVRYFPISKAKESERSRGKIVRNGFYYGSGGLMAICMIWAAIEGSSGGSIFLAESGALIAFAVSWLAKGRADHTVRAAAVWTMYYGRHPVEAVSDVWNAISTQNQTER